MSRFVNPANWIGAWLALAAAVLSIKFVLLAIDPLALFFMGDSGAYLGSVIYKWKPNDRSFTYGLYVIGPILAAFGSLKAVVVSQSVLSSATAILAAVCLRVGFRAPFWVAAIAALLYAVEPLALLYERMIMTEAAALFFLALFVLTGLSYINYPRVPLLILLALLGTCVLSLRTFYIPVVLVSTIAAVLLGMPHLKDRSAEGVRAFGLRFLLHALVAITATIGFHAAYKQYFAYVTGSPPSYNSGGGLFLVSGWAPLITPADFPNKAMAERVLTNLEYDLHDRRIRVMQRFATRGLVGILVEDQRERFGHDLERKELAANDVAKKIALRAAGRDPIGPFGLAAETYADYWDGEYMSQIIQMEDGWAELPQDKIDYFKACCEEDVSERHLQDTFAKRWHGAANIWYRFLLLTPLFAILLCIPREHREQAIFVGVIVWVAMFVSVLFVVSPSVRFHHALAWLACIQLGMVLSYIACKFAPTDAHLDEVVRHGTESRSAPKRSSDT